VIAYPVLAPHTAYRWDLVHGEHQIVHPQGMLVLNEAAAAVIRLCDGRPREEILAALGRAYGKVTEEHVDALLQALARRSLIRDVQAEPLLRHP
jgi:hypothetical protein